MSSHTDAALALAAATMALTWLLLTLWVMLDRLVHDAGHRRLELALHALHDPHLAALPLGERMGRVHRILRPLRLRSLETLMMSSLPGWALDACSVRIGQLRPPQGFFSIVRAGPQRTRKWKYIAALFVIARARHRDRHVLLQQALSATDPDIRNAAINLLGELGDRAAAAILVAGMQSSRSLRNRIASQLDAFMQPIGDLLHPLHNSDDPELRAWGAMLLRCYTDQAGVDAQLAALSADADAGVRKAALQSLAEADSPLAAATARRLLRDETPYVRAQAARTLSQSDPGEAAARDIAPLLEDPDWWVRQTVKESLSRIGLAAMPHVLPLLGCADRFARNSAADVLQHIGAVAMLAERAQTPDAGGAEAGELLQRIMQAGERRMIGAAGDSHPSWRVLETGEAPA